MASTAGGVGSNDTPRLGHSQVAFCESLRLGGRVGQRIA